MGLETIHILVDSLLRFSATMPLMNKYVTGRVHDLRDDSGMILRKKMLIFLSIDGHTYPINRKERYMKTIKMMATMVL